MDNKKAKSSNKITKNQILKTKCILYLVLLFSTTPQLARAHDSPSDLDHPDNFSINEQPAWLHVFAGQSNMVGYKSAVNSPHGNSLPNNVELYVVNAKTHQIERHYKFRRHSPAIPFAHHMASAYPNRRHIILKAAKGATGLYDWRFKWKQGDGKSVTEHQIRYKKQDGTFASKTVNGENLLRRRVKGHILREFLPHIVQNQIQYKTLLWMQGASDVSGKRNEIFHGFFKSGVYHYDNLNSVLNAAQVQGYAPEHIILARMGTKGATDRDQVIKQNLNHIRIAQNNIVQNIPNVLGLKVDNLDHYDNCSVSKGTCSPSWHFRPTSVERFGECLQQVFVRAESGQQPIVPLFPCNPGQRWHPDFIPPEEDSHKDIP